MNTSIVFTPSQILALCSAIVVISGGVHVFMDFIYKISAPNKLQNKRLDNIELRLDKHDEIFKKDLMRFEEIDESTRVTQKAILALLSHSIDGNEVTELKEAKKELQDYLIKR